jgi:hypothetical protein
MKRLFTWCFVLCMFQICFSCKSKVSSVTEEPHVVSVKATHITRGDIENEISFNGSTVYLKKNPVVSPIAGYIVSVRFKFGDEVRKDEVLFEIETRESRALEPGVSTAGDISKVKVPATSGGFINELNINDPGGYVSEGATLCTIADNKDLMVKLNIPFEYQSLLTKGNSCKMRLTDNTVITGSVFRILPVMDPANQTQTVLIKPGTNRQLPENLNLSVSFINEKHRNSFLVTKSSLMTNDTQSEFWVMKIDNNNMAVKIPVGRGIENDSIAEILSPFLNVNDLIVSEGAYGLPDSTIIRIAR